MQETEYKSGDDEMMKRMIEILTGKTDKEVKQKMETRFEALEKEGHKLIQRKKLRYRDPCPCGSGLKFGKCCINKPFGNLLA